jgi:hypothetical protein
MIELPRSLHRLTLLHDDPAAAWLPRRARVAVLVASGAAWATFGTFLLILWLGGVLLSEEIIMVSSSRLSTVVVAVVAGALVNPVRRAIIRMRSDLTASRVRAAVPSLARPIDHWAHLGRQPDGCAVSVVGWARGRSRLAYRVAGQPCFGLALPCQDKYPGVLETLHDFDLLDESGASLPIRVAGGRMLGDPNVQLSGGNTEERFLVASLEMPVGAVPADWRAYVLRDGDPVMVVGFKTTIVDPAERGFARPVPRAAIASASSRALLIFPIDAERREV